MPGAGCRVPGAGCRVPGAGCRVTGDGCGVRGRRPGAASASGRGRTLDEVLVPRRQASASTSAATSAGHLCRPACGRGPRPGPPARRSSRPGRLGFCIRAAAQGGGIRHVWRNLCCGSDLRVGERLLAPGTAFAAAAGARLVRHRRSVVVFGALRCGALARVIDSGFGDGLRLSAGRRRLPRSPRARGPRSPFPVSPSAFALGFRFGRRCVPRPASAVGLRLRPAVPTIRAPCRRHPLRRQGFASAIGADRTPPKFVSDGPGTRPQPWRVPTPVGRSAPCSASPAPRHE
ncbi:hypothetical protein FSY75_02635 [Streptomyces sp. TR1341]|nr:hypothetical protein [Streptomyces sp. TR1341]